MKDLSAGACYGVADESWADDDPFHPEAHRGRNGAPDYTRARIICSTCTIRDLCLEDALASEFDSYRVGMRGGLTPDERSDLAAKQKRPQPNALTPEQDAERMRLWRLGLSDKVAAGYIGISDVSFRYWRKRRGLAANYRSDGSGKLVSA